MKFSKQEKKDLLFAWVLLSIAFAILLSGVSFSFSNFILAIIISFFTAGLGFLLHELMHKKIAQGYGLFAEFRASYRMLFLAILFSFFGFIIAAPGAVMIRGRVTEEKNGKISLAGPATNVLLAVFFLIPFVIFNPSPETFFFLFFSYGLLINSLLAAFNLIPVGNFDGRKVLRWNKPVYFTTLAIALSLFIGSYIL